MLRCILLVVWVCAYLPPAVAAQDPVLEVDLHEILARFLATNSMAPGISAQVTCPPLGLDWSGAVGTVSRESDEPLTVINTFRIASNTKTYVAAAILRLAELNRLDLDSSLGSHLPTDQVDFLTADGYDLNAINLRQVLSHTSGLHEHCHDERYGDAIVADPQHQWTRSEQIRQLVDWEDPAGQPGEGYFYSDTGYVMLGGIIERITGQNLGAAVRDLLDYPGLGLNVTWWETLEVPPAAAGTRAHQYFGDHDTSDWNPSFDLYGGGGIVTDTLELGRFMRLLLKGDVLKQDASLAAMTGDGTASYRLGLMSMELGGHQVWGHQGFWNTFAFHVPSLDLTVSGCILNHHAENGKVLAAELIERVSRARQ